MLRVTRDFLSMIRFSHTLFALPFALLSALLAWQDVAFQWLHLAGIILCMVLARSAAMAFNRLADRDVDARNPRTANRQLATGALTPRAVWVFTIATCVAFVAATLLFLPNYWPVALSLPVLIFIGVYSLTKRFTSLAHFWLGASLMMAPLAAWIALRGLQDLTTPALLGAAVLFWVAGFDMLYACQDVDFDRKSKLHSIPAKLGIPRTLRLAAACHLLMWFLLAALTIASPHLHWIFAAGLGLLAALLLYEHALVRPDDLTRVNKAFFQVNAVISVGLLALGIVQITLKI